MSLANSMTKALLVEIPKRFPNAWAWRSNPVNAMAPGAGGRLRRISSGLPGEPDVTVVLSPAARLGGIEVKAGKDRMRDSQIAWRNKILEMGGFYLVCRDVAVTLDEIGVLYRGEGN